MGRQLVAYLKNKATTAKALLSAARPANAGDGTDVTIWRSGAFTFPDVGVFIDTDAASVLSAIDANAAGVEVWGRQLGNWYYLAVLNDGLSIKLIGAGQGYSQELHDVGDYDELAIVAAKTAGNVTFTFVPMERHTY